MSGRSVTGGNREGNDRPSTHVIRRRTRGAGPAHHHFGRFSIDLLRALATIQGSLELLSPQFPLVAAAQDLGSEQFAEALRPENLEDEIRREVIRLAPVLRRAPYHLDRIADQVEQGNLGMRIRLFSHDEDVDVVTRLANRAILAFLSATLGVVSVMMLQVEGGPTLTGNVSLFDTLALIGLFAGAILLMRVVLEILRDP